MKLLLAVIVLGCVGIATWFFKKETYNGSTTLLWLGGIVLAFVFVFIDSKNYKKIGIKIDRRHLLFLILMALTIRFWMIDKLPTGVWTDEIEISVAGRNLWHQMKAIGAFIPFTAEATGHPALTSIITGVSLDILGNNVLALRLPSVVFGALSVGLMYVFLSLSFGQRIGITGGIVAALSYWHISLSRIAFEATYYWFFQILSLIFLILLKRSRNPKYGAFMGISVGLGIYTYLAFRTMAVGMLLSILVLYASKILDLKTLVKSGFYYCFFLLVLTIPLFFYARHHPQEVLFRSRDVSLFNQKFAGTNRVKMVTENTLKTIGMFFYQGDPNPRHNLAGKPQLDLITFGFVLAGLYLAVKKKKYFDLTIWFILGSIAAAAGIFTYEPPYIIQPHCLRTLGLWPILIWIFAFSVNELSKNKTWMRYSLLMIIGGINLFNYFGVKMTKDIYDRFQFGQTITALRMKDTCDVDVAVSKNLINRKHVEFFASECKYHFYNEEIDLSGPRLLNQYDYSRAKNKKEVGLVDYENFSFE